MRPVRALLLVALTTLAIASSAQAVPCSIPQWPPVQPPPCPVSPEPGHGGILGEVESILHTMTQATCSVANDVDDILAIGYGLVVGEAQIVTNSMRAPVDQTQDNVCAFVYGDPNPPEVACQSVPDCPTKVPPF